MSTFCKINGEWCIRSTHALDLGQTVTVTKRNGQTSQAVVGPVAGEGADFYFYKIATAPRRATEVVGDLSGIIAMFARARQHLRHPAIVLDGFRVNVAGDRAREPGSLTLTSVERTAPRQAFTALGLRPGLQREYYGRVTLAGVYEPTRRAPADLGARLRAFAADPAGVAAAYGRLHGACCFCRRALRDERSTAVGYGPDCADHFGLPWGTRAAAAVDLVTQQLGPALAATAAPNLQPALRGDAEDRAVGHC